MLKHVEGGINIFSTWKPVETSQAVATVHLIVFFVFVLTLLIYLLLGVGGKLLTQKQCDLFASLKTFLCNTLLCSKVNEYIDWIF
jgi:hypothetical protein